MILGEKHGTSYLPCTKEQQKCIVIHLEQMQKVIKQLKKH